MQIPKQQILDLIKQHAGGQEKAAQADAELPDQVDTEQHQGLLDKFGINIGDLLGGAGGGIAGKLGL